MSAIVTSLWRRSERPPIVCQTPDYWGNDYFDDTFFRNGEEESFEGYCTDVWFDEAMKFIERNKDQSFFCYLSTNAPHGPFRVPSDYSDIYREKVPDSRANFYGMITNIDENMARLRTRLKNLGIEDNTILIFMTDNGSAAGCELDRDQYVSDGFNAGMRGMKGSAYEGGHRVPFFMHWPDAGFTEGRDVDRLSANIDLLPTLIDLCQLRVAEDCQFHGISLVPLFDGEIEEWPDRVIVTDSQRVEHPIKWRQSATMTQRWRLINGVELYDILIDPEQRNDVSIDQSDLVDRLREHYEKWWDLVSPRFDEDCPIVIGSQNEKISLLTSHDWHGESHAWNQGQIRGGLECNGYWAIEIAEDGEYIFELRRWPKEEDKSIMEGIEGEIIDLYNGGKALSLKTARIQIGDQEQMKVISAGDKGVKFIFNLKAGETRLQTFLTGEDGFTIGAYYVYAGQV